MDREMTNVNSGTPQATFRPSNLSQINSLKLLFSTPFHSAHLPVQVSTPALDLALSIPGAGVVEAAGDALSDEADAKVNLQKAVAHVRRRSPAGVLVPEPELSEVIRTPACYGYILRQFTTR